MQVGDRVELVRDSLPYSLEVTGIPARRGPAAEAQACYVEDEEVVHIRELKVAALKQDRMLMPKTPGRPDKRTRRKLRERSRRLTWHAARQAAARLWRQSPPRRPRSSASARRSAPSSSRLRSKGSANRPPEGWE